MDEESKAIADTKLFQKVMGGLGVPTWACPACGQNAPGGFERVILQPDPAATTLEMRQIPALSVTCGNCGYISLFDMKAMEDLVEEMDEGQRDASY